MTDVNREQLLATTREIVLEHAREGSLHTITKRTVRDAVLKRYNLTETYLEDKPDVRHDIGNEIRNTMAPPEVDALKPSKNNEASSGAKPWTSEDVNNEGIPGDASNSKTKRSKSDSNDEQSTSEAGPSTVTGPKRKKLKKSFKSSETIHDSDQEGPASDASASSLPPKKSSKVEKTTKRREKNDKDSKVNGKSKTSKAADPKEDETVKKLKGYVSTCGVRKQWKKEFADCPTTQSQTRKLKTILQELGMQGRPTLEKAKQLRLRRELEQEQEDVEEFAAKYAGKQRRSQAKAESAGKNADDNSEEEEDDDDDDAQPRRRKKNAVAAITSFLGDQESSD